MLKMSNTRERFFFWFWTLGLYWAKALCGRKSRTSCSCVFERGWAESRCKSIAAAAVTTIVQCSMSVFDSSCWYFSLAWARLFDYYKMRHDARVLIWGDWSPSTAGGNLKRLRATRVSSQKGHIFLCCVVVFLQWFYSFLVEWFCEEFYFIQKLHMLAQSILW